MNKIKLTANILFAGVGMQERGIENSGLFDLDVVITSEIDKHAILSYAAVHHGLTKEQIDEEYTNTKVGIELDKDFYVDYLITRKIGYDFQKRKMPDWSRCKPKELYMYYRACELNRNVGDIASVTELPYADLWTFSYPCFTGDTLVLSNKGYLPIKELNIGDYVLTHTNTYQPITDVQMTGIKEIWNVSTMCSDLIKCTENHRFYTRTRYRERVKINNKVKNVRKFTQPEWTECKDLTNNHYVGYAINTNSIPFSWNGVNYNYVDGRIRHKDNISDKLSNSDFWWVIGRYVADGWRRTQGGIVICCGKNKIEELEKRILLSGYNYTKIEERTAFKLQIPDKELQKFTEIFGYKAIGKKIPAEIIDMPIKELTAFFEGYMSGDGCFTQGRYKAATISRELVYGLGQIVAKIYHTPFSIYKTKRKPIVKIEGRICNQHDSYAIVFKKDVRKQDKAFYENGYIWFPVNEVYNTHKTEEVYDITVKGDHSFTANGCIVHNCTDLSISGDQKGMVKGLTRSGLVYEVTRLLEVANTNGTAPKFLLMENVDALVSKKFKPVYDALNEYFDTQGYNCYWQVLNAKDHGVPQNRKRVFALYIRKDVDNGKFTFPKPYDSGIKLRDILDKNVANKYFLSKEIQERFYPIESNTNVIGSTAPPFRTIGQSDLVYDKETYMSTLCARDYKQPKQIKEE